MIPPALFPLAGLVDLAPAAVPAAPAPPAQHHGPLLVLDADELARPLRLERGGVGGRRLVAVRVFLRKWDSGFLWPP